MGNMCGSGKNKETAGEMPKLIFVAGGPGAGKGTQCKNLVEKFKFEHLSTGDLLRAFVATKSEKAIELKELMAAGGLVPTKALLELVEAELQKKGWGKCKPILIDGFPRNQENLDVFAECLAPKTKLVGVLNFELDDETMRARILGRNEGRDDDNEAAILNRLSVFNKETVPTINKLKEAGNVCTIDTSQSKEQVFVATEAHVCKMLGMEAPKNAAPKKEAAPVEKKVVEVVEEVKVEAVVEVKPDGEVVVEEEKVIEEVKVVEEVVEEPKVEDVPAE